MRWLHPLLLGFGILAIAGAPPKTVAAEGVWAGVAKQDLQLPEGVPLAGYSRRGGDPAHGTHDAVGVRALVVQDADSTVALVSCDLLIIDERLFGAVQRRLRTADPDGELTLLLAATHTHSGPGAYGHKFLEKLSMGHFNPEVFEAIVDQTADTILRARSQLQPVRLAYQRGATEGLLVNRVDPKGTVEAELIVSAFYPEAEESPLAVLVNFAAHPTTLGAWNMEFSADYPGVVMRAIEARWPSAICLFFAAAVGDQAPVKRGNDFEPARWLGERVAEHAIALLTHARPAAPTSVEAWHEDLPLPPAKLRLGRFSLPRWLSQRFVDDDATLSTALIGDVVFQGVPCDLTADLGQQLKEAAQAHGLQPVIVGFANDYIGYCVPETLYHTDAYEASLAFNGPRTGELIVQHLIQMLNQSGER